MHRNLFSAFSLAFCLTLFFPCTVMAKSELDYVLGVAVGVRNVDFELTSASGPSFFVLEDSPGVILPAPSQGDVTIGFEESLYTALFSGTLIFDRFHLSAALDLPFQAENTQVYSIMDATGQGPGFAAGTMEESKSELDRIDFSLTAGFRVWKGLSFFSGYKYTEFDLKSREFSSLLEDKDQNYVEEGLFVGGSYVWKIRTAGSFSLSVAYANVDAEYSENNVPDKPPEGGTAFREFTYSGTAKGLSYGAQWSGRLAKQWLYNIGLKRQSYQTNNDTSTLQLMVDDGLFGQPVTSSPIPVTDIDTDHTDTVFSIGVLYTF